MNYTDISTTIIEVYVDKVKKVSFLEFRKNLSEYVNLAKYKGERFLITRNGKVVAGFVPVEDLEKIESIENISDQKKDE